MNTLTASLRALSILSLFVLANACGDDTGNETKSRTAEIQAACDQKCEYEHVTCVADDRDSPDQASCQAACKAPAGGEYSFVALAEAKGDTCVEYVLGLVACLVALSCEEYGQWEDGNKEQHCWDFETSSACD